MAKMSLCRRGASLPQTRIWIQHQLLQIDDRLRKAEEFSSENACLVVYAHEFTPATILLETLTVSLRYDGDLLIVQALSASSQNVQLTIRFAWDVGNVQALRQALETQGFTFYREEQETH